jgi:Mg-chelatase subunit ChlD
VTATIAGRPRRDLLGAAITAYKPASSAGTPLYQTVLDGEAKMRASAKPGTVTLVVVLTDGQDGQSRFAMTNQAFLAKLTASRDANRPVPILAIGYGADADMGALTAMAKTTGGKAVAATNPADVASAMAEAFLAAHSPS